MRSHQVTNGDIVLDSGGRMQFVKGTNKLAQDLSLWLAEEYGIGFTTSNFGSTLFDLVGQGVTSGTLSQTQAEVKRIVTLYQQQQIQNLQQAQQQQQLSYYNKSELIASVDSVQVSPNNNAISAIVYITTMANTILALNIQVDSNGVTVNNG